MFKLSFQAKVTKKSLIEASEMWRLYDIQLNIFSFFQLLLTDDWLLKKLVSGWIDNGSNH